jgi:arsenite oxidase small subunit
MDNSPNEKREGRRGFLFGTVLGSVLIEACDATSQESPRPTVGNVNELVAGRPQYFIHPDLRAQAVLVKLGERALGGIGPEGDIVAFFTACPHMGCELGIDTERNVAGPCGCHRSRFDLTRGGAQIIGRATQNLVQIELEAGEDGSILAGDASGLPYGCALTEGDR